MKNMNDMIIIYDNHFLKNWVVIEKFGLMDPLNFDGNSKWSSEMFRTGLQILIEYKLGYWC